jgi:diguanylate cyclase (GGDEF)-like protein
MDPATESWRLLWLCDGEPIDPMLATVAEAAGFAVVEGTATGVGVDPHGPSTVAAVPLGPDPASTFAEMRKLRGRDPHTPFLLLSATRDLPHRVPRILNDAVVGLLSPPWTAEVATALLAYAKDVRRLRERRLHPTSGDLRVLLVEDDDADAEYIGELLGPLHAHPRRAVRLQEALELVEEHSFDLMLCDLSLPDARGVDVVSALHAVRPGVPIVVITGARDEALAQEVIRIGAQDCLAKGTLDAHGLARSTRHAMERAASEQRIAFLASHDVLTGLANRRLFQAHLEQCLARARRRVEEMSTLFIDLDRFKAVNDSLGHAVGDEVLKTVARRLEAEMRDYDTIARIGGDEFAVVIDAGPSVARGISERIIASLSEPVIGPFGQASVGASVGIASFPRSGRDPVTLLRATDRAMYRAKSLGGVAPSAPGTRRSRARRIGRRAASRSRRSASRRPSPSPTSRRCTSRAARSSAGRRCSEGRSSTGSPWPRRRSSTCCSRADRWRRPASGSWPRRAVPRPRPARRGASR